MIDGRFEAKVRVVDGLPFDLVLGTAFMRHARSTSRVPARGGSNLHRPLRGYHFCLGSCHRKRDADLRRTRKCSSLRKQRKHQRRISPQWSGHPAKTLCSRVLLQRRPCIWERPYGNIRVSIKTERPLPDSVRDSFSPLQLDVFHAMWEDYCGPEIAARPPGPPSRGKREVATREEALSKFPLGTEVARELMDKEGNVILNRGRVCDFYDPYWRVEYGDGDWEELTRRELRQAMVKAEQLQPPAQQDS